MTRNPFLLYLDDIQDPPYQGTPENKKLGRYFQAMLPQGTSFRSPEKYFDAATAKNLCPVCAGELKGIPGSPPKHLCQTEQRAWTMEQYRKYVVQRGFCPSCGLRLTKHGRPRGGHQRFICSSENKTWTDARPASWGRLTGIRDDKFREAVLLWKLGWSARAIQKRTRVRKASLLRIFRDPLLLGDALFQLDDAGVQPIYHYLYANLRRLKSPMAYKIPATAPGKEQNAVLKYLKRILLAKDQLRRSTSAEMLLLALKEVLVMVAQGQLGKVQLQKYLEQRGSSDSQIDIHLGRYRGRTGNTQWGRTPRNCMHCGCLPLSGRKYPFIRSVDTALHQFGNCVSLANILQALSRAYIPAPNEPPDYEETKYRTIERKDFRAKSIVPDD